MSYINIIQPAQHAYTWDYVRNLVDAIIRRNCNGGAKEEIVTTNNMDELSVIGDIKTNFELTHDPYNQAANKYKGKRAYLLA